MQQYSSKAYHHLMWSPCGLHYIIVTSCHPTTRVQCSAKVIYPQFDNTTANTKQSSSRASSSTGIALSDFPFRSFRLKPGEVSPALLKAYITTQKPCSTVILRDALLVQSHTNMFLKLLFWRQYGHWSKVSASCVPLVLTRSDQERIYDTGNPLEEGRIYHFLVQTLHDDNYRQNAAIQYQNVRQTTG